MDNLVLYGKEKALDSIVTAYNAGRLPHALLIVGEKGTGKKVFADEICRLLVCRGEKHACGVCAQCKKVTRNIHPDIFKIFPAGKSETIGVNEIKPIGENLYIMPNDAACKIFVIYGAERMNRFAQNSMLKMIEDPPDDSFFIFTCENSQALLPTVLSRVTSIRLLNAQICDAEAEILREYPSVDAQTAKKAAERSNGNIGLALELCSGSSLCEIYDDAEDIAKKLCIRDRAQLCLSLGKYAAKKDDAVRLVQLLLLVMRDCCAALSGEKSCQSGLLDAVDTLTARGSTKGFLSASEACQDYLTAISGNANPALSLAAFEIKIGDALK